MQISQELHKEIHEIFHYKTVEQGGIIGLKNNEIVTYYHDKDGECAPNFYKPNIDSINRHIHLMLKEGCTDFGFIHSHPGNRPLSECDIHNARTLIKENNYSFLPMILVLENGLSAFYVTQTQCLKVPLVIQEEPIRKEQFYENTVQTP